jgi:hypothetical protein
MLARILVGLLMFFPFAVQSDNPILLNVKVGLWETTITSTMTGMPSIPDSALAQLSPDQRAKIQQMIQERSGKPTTTKSCLTKEKLQKSNPFQNAPKGCTYTVTSSTSSKMEVKMQCSQNGMTMTGNVVVSATDSENVKGTVHMNTTGGNGSSGSNPMNMNSTFTSKWLGAACGDVQ